MELNTKELNTQVQPLVEVDALAFHFKTRSVFTGLDLRLAPGLTWLRGRNGRGKTTLLKLLGGALAPGSGSIRLNGLDSRRDALAYRRHTFYCGGEAPELDWLRPANGSTCTCRCIRRPTWRRCRPAWTCSTLPTWRASRSAACRWASIKSCSCHWRWPCRCSCC